MDSLILYDNGNQPHKIPVANGFVSRVVSAVFHENHADAQRVAEILNSQDQIRTALKALEKAATEAAEVEAGKRKRSAWGAASYSGALQQARAAIARAESQQ